MSPFRPSAHDETPKPTGIAEIADHEPKRDTVAHDRWSERQHCLRKVAKEHLEIARAALERSEHSKASKGWRTLGNDSRGDMGVAVPLPGLPAEAPSGPPVALEGGGSGG